MKKLIVLAVVLLAPMSAFAQSKEADPIIIDTVGCQASGHVLHYYQYAQVDLQHEHIVVRNSDGMYLIGDDLKNKPENFYFKDGLYVYEFKDGKESYSIHWMDDSDRAMAYEVVGTSATPCHLSTQVMD